MTKTSPTRRKKARKIKTGGSSKHHATIPALSFKEPDYLLRLAQKYAEEYSDSPSEFFRLVDLEFKQDELKTPGDALDAVILAGQLGGESPPWAWRMLKDVRDRRATDNRTSLDQSFGFTAKKSGATSEIKKRTLALRYHKALADVLTLNLCGVSIEEACDLVAVRVGLKLDTLRKRYWSWKRIPVNSLPAYVELKRKYLKDHKDEILGKYGVLPRPSPLRAPKRGDGLGGNIQKIQTANRDCLKCEGKFHSHNVRLYKLCPRCRNMNARD